VLSGPSTDLMYRQESSTDHEGRYTFRASPAPKGKNWSVIFLNKGVDIVIGDGVAVSGPDFVVSLEVKKKKKTVQQPLPHIQK